MRIKQQKQILRLNNGAVNEIIRHPLRSDCVLMTGAQGKVSCLNMNPLKLQDSYQIFFGYSTCILAIGRELCVGSSTGQLVLMRCSGQVIKKLKISNECLSSMVLCDRQLVVTSFDGVVRFLNRDDFVVERQIDVDVPIWDCEYYENQVYLAGNPSFVINLETFEKKQMKRLDSFSVHNNKLYACSDEKGLTCLKSNSNSYIPCSFMLPLKDRLMTFSEECVSEIKHEQQMEWKCHRIKQIEKGVSIRSGCSIGNMIILGDNQGTVYRIDYEMIEKSECQVSVGTDDQEQQI